MEVANSLLESFREPPKAFMTNSSRTPTDLKGKENPDLPLVCSNYWPPIMAFCLCFNYLILSTFRQCSQMRPFIKGVYFYPTILTMWCQE